MYKGYINLSRNLIQNYTDYGLSSDDLCFLLKILSYKREQILTDDILKIEKHKALKIRKKLKSKGLITYFSQKNIGTIYYVYTSKLIDLIQDKKTNINNKKSENDKITDNINIFSKEEIDTLLCIMKSENYKREDLNKFDMNFLRKILDNYTK